MYLSCNHITELHVLLLLLFQFRIHTKHILVHLAQQRKPLRLSDVSIKHFTHSHSIASSISEKMNLISWSVCYHTAQVFVFYYDNHSIICITSGWNTSWSLQLPKYHYIGGINRTAAFGSLQRSYNQSYLHLLESFGWGSAWVVTCGTVVLAIVQMWEILM